MKLSGREHLEDLLARHVARQRHHGRGTEQADIHAVDAEAGVPSAATARSQDATSWQPAAVAMPCTSAITGCGTRWIICIIAEQRSEEIAHGRRAAIVGLALGGHFLEVVARAERLSGAAQHHDAGGLGLLQRTEGRCQIGQHGVGQSIEVAR